MINAEGIKISVLADMDDLGVYDADSISILAIGRVAQAALASEIETKRADGVREADIDAYCEERGAQIDRWMQLETEKVRTRAIVREEVERCLG